jgi:hypothetical protein
MSIRTLAPLLVLGAFLLSACGGPYADMGSPVAPGVQRASLSVTPSTLLGQPKPFGTPAPFAGCPSVSPFTVPFTLVVTAGNVAFAVTSVTVRFTDSFGAQMPQVTLPAPVPVTPFGTALVQARSGQSFPMSFGIGCGTGTTGTVVILIHTRDVNGRTDTAQLTAVVR